MKPYLKIALALLLGVTPCFAGFDPVPRLWAVDSLRNQTELVNFDQKTTNVIKIGNKPMKLKPLASQNGYLLLCQGTAKLLGNMSSPGEFIYLDRAWQPTGTPVKLPGIVTKELYLETCRLWLTVTTQNKAVTLNLLETESSRHHQIKLAAVPEVYQLSPDQNQLALTINPPGQISAAEVLLIDLKTFRTKSFPVGINSGAVYFSAANQIMVASGGFRDSQKYPDRWKVQSSEQPVPAKLQLINLESGQLESVPIGYSPVAVIQDQNQPDTFYSTSCEKARPLEPLSTLRIIRQGKVTAQLEIADEILRIIQTPSGNLCLLGQVRFYLINPQTAKVLTEIVTQLRINSVKISQDGNTGFLFIVNSSKIPVIDLKSGEQLTTVNVKHQSILDTFKSFNLGGSLFTAAAAPVTGNNPIWENKIANSPPNERILYSQTQNRLFVLTGSSQISVISLKTNQIERTIKLSGSAAGFHPVPESNRLMAVTDRSWDLIDPEKNQPVLSVKISREDQSAQKGYYSPDGARLVVPFLHQLYLIDTQNARFLGKIRTKAEQPYIIWP